MLKISEIDSKISQTLNSPVTDTFDVGGYIFKLSTLVPPTHSSCVPKVVLEIVTAALILISARYTPTLTLNS